MRPAADEGGVVDAAPRQNAAVGGVGAGLLIHLSMELGLLLQRLRGVDPAVERRSGDRAHRLADQVGDAWNRRRDRGVAIRRAIVVIPEHVLGPAGRGLGVHRSGGLARAVELVGELPSLGIQRRIAGGLVESRSPDDDRRPVAIADHHVVHVLQEDPVEVLVSDVLPARRLLPHHQPQLIAGVEEMRRLRVVRAADHVAVELVLDQLRIPGLKPRRRRHPGVGKQLVTVESEDLEPFAVQVEAVQPKDRLPEAHRHLEGVGGDRRAAERDPERVELRPAWRPQPDPAQVAKAEREDARLMVNLHLDRPGLERPGAVAQLHGQLHRFAQPRQRVDGDGQVELRGGRSAHRPAGRRRR